MLVETLVRLLIAACVAVLSVMVGRLIFRSYARVASVLFQPANTATIARSALKANCDYIAKNPDKRHTIAHYGDQECRQHLGTLVWLPADVKSEDYFKELTAKKEARRLTDAERCVDCAKFNAAIEWPRFAVKTADWLPAPPVRCLVHCKNADV